MKIRACSLLVVGVSVAALCGCANMQNRNGSTSLTTAPPPPPTNFGPGPTQLDLNAPLAPPPSAGGYSSAADLNISNNLSVASAPGPVAPEKISKPETAKAVSKPVSKPSTKSKPYNMASSSAKKTTPAKKNEVAKKTETAKKSDAVATQNKTIAKLANMSKPNDTKKVSPPASAPPATDPISDDMLGLPVRKNENSSATPEINGNENQAKTQENEQNVVPVSDPAMRPGVSTRNII